MKLAVLSSLLALGLSAAPAPSPVCDGSVYAGTIHGVNDLVPVKTVEHGSLYRFTQVDPPLLLVNVSGSAYEMGYARGQLLHDEIIEQLADTYEWIEGGVIEPYLKFLPKELQAIIAELGIVAALDATRLATYEWTASYFKEEAQGIADATGLSYEYVFNMQFLPELIKASCSIVGAHSSATEKGGLVQLRALDWNTATPLQKYPAVVVYHPDSSFGGHPFAQLGWASFMGALTGMSSSPLGICEKVWLHGTSTSRFGMPWTFVLRDVLQFDSSVPEAVHRLQTVPRTCSIFVGLGDGNDPSTFTIAEYEHDQVKIWNATDSPTWPGHPSLPNILYVDKHTQPSAQPCLGETLRKYSGTLNRENMANVAAIEETGSMHMAIFDFTVGNMTVFNAAPYVNGSAVPSFLRDGLSLPLSLFFGSSQ
jgi:hypothetical protein